MATKGMSKKYGKETQDKGPRNEAFESEASTAPRKLDIPPKLKFGAGKTSEGSYDVEFLEASVRDIEFEDQYAEPGDNGEQPTSKAWAINLIVHAMSWPEERDVDKKLQAELEQLKSGGPAPRRHVVLRLPEETVVNGKKTKKYHSLTQGILNLYKTHGTLLGVKARLQTRGYDGRFGETRAYDVIDMTKDEQEPLPEA